MDDERKPITLELTRLELQHLTRAVEHWQDVMFKMKGLIPGAAEKRGDYVAVAELMREIDQAVSSYPRESK
jgi:hypothetical protein